MSAHTPGPWVASEYVGEPMRDGEACHRIDAKGADISRPIGLVWGDNAVWLTRAEKDANARLIAAAPDLLAFAERYLHRCDRAFGTDGPPITHPERALWEEAFEVVGRAATAKAVGK